MKPEPELVFLLGADAATSRVCTGNSEYVALVSDFHQILAASGNFCYRTGLILMSVVVIFIDDRIILGLCSVLLSL